MTLAPVPVRKRALPAVGGQEASATRVLHVLDHSLPEQSGYASRSHAILLALERMGLHVEAITSPKHGPAAGDEAITSPKHGSAAGDEAITSPTYGSAATGDEEIDSVRYVRTEAVNEPLTGVRGQLRTILATRRRVRRYLLEHDADLVHAHSPCLNGLAVAALGRPRVYEMRSSWEDAAVSSGTTTEGSLRYRLSRLLETAVVGKADAVVVICEGLKRELVDRGVAEARITVVPNALPENMLELGSPRREALRSELGLEGKRVIGFFGSFFEWEGVDALVRVLPAVKSAVPEAHLLLAGGGRQEAQLRALVRTLGLEQAVTFAGRVGPDSIRAFYGAADVMAFPRVSERLTEMVTPLKPLEAMAQHRPVIASDVGGHRELVRDDKTGFLYPAGDDDALAHRIIEVLGGDSGSGSAIDAVTQTARRFVERERRWSVVSEAYLPVYERLLKRPLAFARETAGRETGRCRAR